MKINNYFSTFLVVFFLCFSCSGGDDTEEPEKEITISELTTFSVDRIHQFISNQANLIIDVDDYSTIQVTSNNNNVVITKIDDLNYKITSTEVGSELISITVIDDKGNQLKGDRRLYFYEHGTRNYNTVEGIKIDTDTSISIFNLHGEPEGKTTSTTTGNTPITYEYWYYFSKGFYFIVNKSSDTVIAMRIYGTTWSRTIDDIVKSGSFYPYEIDGLSKLNSTNGLLMDEIIQKYGEPNTKSASSSTLSTLKWYTYNDLSNSIPSNQYGYFYFFADDIDNYSNKRVLYLTID